eukprot:CAMPEP_0194177208 /NCGR_PEP_ID=MMETSP0154-20130528/11013_1 /TAXON_ID=1049557 /ORGANISM="Thalassiothrix antarctica, Strain L6-D1" /LENGTH=220 /DNA_ID=CAMNT_0038891709 /DNA_START=52 /DNA_END=714 /DNA_ORIENTATION=+
MTMIMKFILLLSVLSSLSIAEKYDYIDTDKNVYTLKKSVDENVYTLRKSVSSLNYDDGGTEEIADNVAATKMQSSDCTTIQLLHSSVFNHFLTDCCANNMCEDGFECRNFNYALKCFPADELPDYFLKVCNDEPVEGYYCNNDNVNEGRSELNCIFTDDLPMDDLMDDPRTTCIRNEDCKVQKQDNPKCRYFRSFLACDEKADFFGVAQPLCNTIEASLF